jgi:diaminohydroxyphosphoribosylaminopyrimidine deaminase/5-amino-6-(5-phosphoribosylamino)uracil reductase
MDDSAPATERDARDARDASYMSRALELAENGWGQTAPNPMVGAVVVRDGEIVGEGFHARYGEAHAEVNALRAAGDRARGATLYVSLEPCAHVGKTPPCTGAIVAAGVSRVVAAVRDPSPIARGGVETLRTAGILVDVGVEREHALELNAPFFHAHASDRPWVTLKLALSGDGAIADLSGTQRWITGAESRREVHRLRANADAIAVGVGTVLADDPSLTVRDVPPPRLAPRRVIFDARLRTPIAAHVVRSALDVPTIFVTSADVPAERRLALERAGVEVLAADGLQDALAALRGHGIRALFCEGGARLAGSMLGAGLVDRLAIFQSPMLIGPNRLGAFDFAPPRFEESLSTLPVVTRRGFGEDELTVYALREVPCSLD